jgi:hypothetical protein
MASPSTLLTQYLAGCSRLEKVALVALLLEIKATQKPVATVKVSMRSAGVYHPSVRTEALLPLLHLPRGFYGSTQVTQQHALRLWQTWHLVH